MHRFICQNFARRGLDTKVDDYSFNSPPACPSTKFSYESNLGRPPSPSPENIPCYSCAHLKKIFLRLKSLLRKLKIQREKLLSERHSKLLALVIGN